MRILCIFAILVISSYGKKEEVPSLEDFLKDPQLFKLIKRLGITKKELAELGKDVDESNSAAEKPVPTVSATPGPEAVTDSVGNKCFYKYHTSTIIRSKESLKAGSHYLRSEKNRTRQDCVISCCYTQGCTLAVFEEKDNNACYLFDCGKNKCVFAHHNHYVAMTLEGSSVIPGGKLGQDNEGDLKDLGEAKLPHPSPTPQQTPVPQKRPVPLYGTCDPTMGDKCLDLNAACINGICQCNKLFQAEKGVCYSVPVKTAPGHSDEPLQAPEQKVAFANPATQPVHYEDKTFQGQRTQGHILPAQLGQGQSQQGQNIQGQGIQQDPMMNQHPPSSIISSPFQQSNAQYNVPVQQQQPVLGPVYNNPLGQRTSTGFLPNQQVIPQSGPMMNQQIQGSYWSSQSGNLVGQKPGSGFYDSSGYINNNQRLNGKYLQPSGLNNRPYTDDFVKNHNQGMPVQGVLDKQQQRMPLDPHRQHLPSNQVSPGVDKPYLLDRNYMTDTRLDTNPDGQYGVDKQNLYRNHPYSPFTDDRYDQYPEDVLPDGNYRDPYYKEQGYQHKVRGHHKEFDKENNKQQTKPPTPVPTTTTTTTTATSTTTTTKKPTTTVSETTMLPTTTAAAQDDSTNTEETYPQWGKHIASSERIEEDYSNQPVDSPVDKNNVNKETDMDFPRQRAGHGRLKPNYYGKKLRPAITFNDMRKNGRINEAAAHVKNLNSAADQQQLGNRPSRVHPKGHKAFRPAGYQDRYPYYSDYRGSPYQNYNWEPQYGNDFLPFGEGDYMDESPAYDYNSFQEDFHGNGKVPDELPNQSASPSPAVSQKPLDTKTVKVPTTDHPKVSPTPPPVSGKVEKIEKIPETEQSNTGKKKPKVTVAPSDIKTPKKSSNKTEKTSTNSSKPINTENSTAKPAKAEHVEVEIGEEDGVVIIESPTDTSQGPIVALALGLAVTMMLLIYVGCRLRNVKRRIRKGRALHSNEADYLINGMYL